jgi:hypothetical protein
LGVQHKYILDLNSPLLDSPRFVIGALEQADNHPFFLKVKLSPNAAGVALCFSKSVIGYAQFFARLFTQLSVFFFTADVFAELKGVYSLMLLR